MADVEEVKKLAALARLAVPEAELERFAGEFEAILKYVGQLNELQVMKGVGEHQSLLPYTNVFRVDGTPHEKGLHTEKLAEQFPAREGDYLLVKQIISHD